MLKNSSLTHYLLTPSLWPIYLVTVLLGLGAFLDVEVLGQIEIMQKSTISADTAIAVAALLFFKNIYTIGLTYLLSYLTFRHYKKMVGQRFDRSFSSHESAYEKEGLANYIANESLQFHLTIILPVCVMISALLQLSILLIGTNSILGMNIMLAFCFIGGVYALYLIPVQLLLSRQGKIRRSAEETRLNFLSNALHSINDIRYGSFLKLAKHSHVETPSEKIRWALTNKWANAEAQKHILELCGLIGISLWYWLTRPTTSDLLVLTSLVFVLYRMAPLITRFIVAFQSFSYGKISFEPPLTVERQFDFSATNAKESIDVHFLDKTIQLQITPSALTLLTGPSGIGKSTLLDRLGQHLQLSGYNVGFISQSPFIIKGTLSDNLFTDQPAPSDLLAKLGLSKLADERQSISSESVSGGEALRIALLRNLINKPDILLLDEPFSALDAENKSKIVDILNNLKDSLPIICVTHEIPEELESPHVITLAKP